MARVLFTSSPAYGHALPMMPLIRAAERAGHEVRVATGPDLVGPLTARGLDVRPVGPSWASCWSAHEVIWSDTGTPEEQKRTDGLVALFGTPALARFADLVVLTRTWRPDLVVHEVLEMAGPLLCRQLGVSSAAHGIGPMFPFYAHLIGFTGAAIGEPQLWDQVSTAPALDLSPPSMRPDGPPPWPGAVPLRPSAGEAGPVPPDVAEVLASDRPLVYFTLGTVKNSNTTDFRTGLAALEGCDGVVVATTGRRVDPDDLGPVPANAVVTEFVPQAALLERADLLVSHSGSGTMLGGLVHGVPQVALPRGTDQPQNAALLARAGAGVVVAPEDYAVATIRAAAAEVTGDPAFRAAAERIRDEIVAMPDADAVWAGLGV
ncbi:glycosyltransferase, MGT family [Geodermatophilus telluris]|uniref:Glycosyltransferase, MGT family n=1 Tax=Geodermatophilus telluris TaxID=1190417 RepID=A0A1G6T126_9ACTN|nr:glycosyltransferase [Geodermatophilus telluris]SDD22177.1 glycosyltransferase, MGT family [Geodermatophilus telluris]